MEIFECKPGNMPEDIVDDFDECVPFVISDDEESLYKEYTVGSMRFGHRCIGKRGRYSWSGRHPRFWRNMTENERRSYNRFMSGLKKLKH